MEWPVCKTVWQFLTKLNMQLLYCSEISFLGIFTLKERKTYVHTKPYKQVFIEALLVIVRKGNDSDVFQRSSG